MLYRLTPKEDHETLENDIYKSLGFNYYTYQSKALECRDALKITQYLDVKGDNKIIAFIKERAMQQAVLLYTSEERASLIMAQITSAQIITVKTDAKTLRDLDQRQKSECFPICITTHPNVMRGFYYRAPNFGISLVVDRGFDSRREAD